MDTPYWYDEEEYFLLEFPFASFSGTPDWSNVDVIRLHFITPDEFGPDVAFDNFRTLGGGTPIESTTWGAIKAGFRDSDAQ